jgi:nitroreductase
MLRNRRSIRKFSNRDLEKEKVDIILKSALLSPSSRSIRPWEFITVTDMDMLQKLSLCREHGSVFLSGAKLAIVVVANPDKSDVWIEDASIASIIIQLAAQSLGLGSCWIQVRQRFHNKEKSAEEYVRELLQIPEKYCVESIIAIGYPDEKKEPHDESKLPYGKIHYEWF